MTKIILCGANGKMGHVIQSVVAGRDDCEIVAGVDINTESTGFPVYSTFGEIKETADVIIDFQIRLFSIPCLLFLRIRRYLLLLQPRVTMTNKKAD